MNKICTICGNPECHGGLLEDRIGELREAAQATFTTLDELLRDPNTYRLEGEFGDAMWEKLWSHRDALALLDKGES